MIGVINSQILRMANSKVFIGVIWASAQRFGTMIISFVTNIVLARLLTPDDFGTIGMLLLFLAIANTFVDSGFGSALIQKKDATQTDFSTVFYINLYLSGIVYGILFLGAPWVAYFYEVEILCPLLRVQGLVLILNAFAIIQTALLRKKMDFRKLSICNLIGNAVGSIIGICSALIGFGVWSLVIRSLVVGFVVSLLLWIVGKWKPMFLFSGKSFKELFGFGGFMLLSSLLATFANNVQTLIIGKLFQQSTLGHYTQARQLRNVASDSISSVIAQVLYPDFSNNQNDDKILSSRLNFSILTISFVTVAIMAFCIVAAKPIILLLYGEKWVDCVRYFQLLCVGGCFVSLQDANYNLVAAKGKSKVLFYFNIGKLVIFCFLMIIGAKLYGIIGLLISMIVYASFAYFVFAGLSSHYLRCSIWGQLWGLIQCLLLSVVPMITVCFANQYFLHGFSNLVQVVIDAVVFGMVYLLNAFFTRNKAFIFLLGMIKRNSNGYN